MPGCVDAHRRSLTGRSTALDDLRWQELTSVNGLGGSLPITDDNPANSARFYRIRFYRIRMLSGGGGQAGYRGEVSR